MQSIYGPPPGSRPRRRLEKRKRGPLRRVLEALGVIVLCTGCFILLVALEISGDDGPDLSDLRIPITMPVYDHAAIFNNLDSNAFRPMQTASIIPSSAIHPATNSAPTRRRRADKPLQSAAIIQR